jgi:ankyrin repeat protein
MYKKVTSTAAFSLLLLCPWAYSMQRPLYPDLYSNEPDARFLGSPTQQMPTYSVELITLIGADKTDEALELIDAGVDLNSIALLGSAPLHEAARRGNLEVVKRLLLKGANVNLEDSSGHTPLYYAIETKKSDVARVLLAHGASNHTSGYSAGLADFASRLRLSGDIIEKLGAREDSSNRRNSIGHLPICDAIRAKDFNRAYSLINNASAAEINRQEPDGRTALHEAVMQQDLALHDTGLLVALLQHGANIDLMDNDRQTPHTLAKSRSQKIEHFLVKTALEHKSSARHASSDAASNVDSSHLSSADSDETSQGRMGLFGIGAAAFALVAYNLLRDK